MVRARPRKADDPRVEGTPADGALRRSLRRLAVHDAASAFAPYARRPAPLQRAECADELVLVHGARAAAIVRATSRVGLMAARAALAPAAPCTPPPGCTEAPARKRLPIGVSVRPSPGVGRKTSCWWIWAVPWLTAPPSRLALAASSAGGVKMWRARGSAREAGGRRSVSAPTRAPHRSPPPSAPPPRGAPPAPPLPR